MQKQWVVLLGVLVALSASAKKIEIVGPPGSKAFGSKVVTLKNGNIVVVDPMWPDGPKTWGAVHLYSPTGVLISTLSGKEGSRVGIYDAVRVLENGNFIVLSATSIDGCPVVGSYGAVTWVDGNTGLNGNVSARNSLVCLALGVHYMSATALSNGNYVVQANGYAAWGDGATGEPRGIADTSNTFTGVSKIYPLSNGNYVMVYPGWGDYKGAATLAQGDTGMGGSATAANSLVGAQPGDYVGYEGIVELTDGNFVVVSPDWSNGGQSDAGAVTWVDGK